MSTVESRLTAARAHALAGKWRELADEALIASILDDAPVGRVAVVTSFGIESAVLLDMVARINQSVPVIFVNSGRLFPETLAYRDRLIEWLGLTDVRTVAADAARVARIDPNEKLYLTDTDTCCRVRKVEPYFRALVAFDVVITGRKRFQDGARADLEKIELVSSRLKINPLAHWSEADISAAFDQRGLPRHPLFFDGYDSVGCAVCSRRRGIGEAPRAGRWSNSEKTECGIHLTFRDERPAVARDNQDHDESHVFGKETAE